jgi:uncharacterized protein YcbK (DUF882 family)
MITLEEAMHGHIIQTIPPFALKNLQDLVNRVNVIRQHWGRPMYVTSGYRTAEDQKRINPTATKSKHMYGQAIDILDDGLNLTRWLKMPEGNKLLEEQGLYCEMGPNRNWVHFQSVPPKSGNRWFLP